MLPKKQMEALENIVINRDTTHYMLRTLRRKGLVRRTCYDLTKKGWDILSTRKGV
jgi:hypothetical protein